jgi:hypothetical protein
VIGFEAETWLIDRGDDIIRKESQFGEGSLDATERLILFLWYTDYCMRNAGDLGNLDDLCADCLEQAEKLARELDKDAALGLFSLRGESFEKQYFERCDAVVTELSETVGDSG